MNRLDLNKMSSKKGDRVMNRLKKLSKITNTLKIKSSETKLFTLIMACSWKQFHSNHLSFTKHKYIKK